MDPDGIASAGNHVDVESCGAINRPLAKGNVGCIAGGVGSIGINLRDILAVAQEVNRYPGVSLLPVGQRADIPIVAAPSCQRYVSHGESIDDMHFIPRGRHLLNEVKGLLPLVLFRIVGNHF
jgi:hypothetical protein